MSDKFGRGKIFLFGILFSAVFFVSHFAFASQTIGTIDGTYKYAWGKNIGWINFGCDRCNVRIDDGNITGYAWSSQFGWIKLDPTTSGVRNNGEGILYGYAWSANLGWINFAGVTIDSNGNFMGYATVKSNDSQINFNCVNASSCGSAEFRVRTDWRPESSRSGSGSGGHPAPPSSPSGPPSATLPEVVPLAAPPAENPSESVLKKIFDFFNPPAKPVNAPVEVPKIAPLSLNTKWNLLPVKAINTFIFAPLPYEINTLASKFPELGDTFKAVGVERFTDISKLVGVNLNITGLAEELNQTIKTVGVEKLTDINKINGVSLNMPGLSEVNGQMIESVGAGKIALITGLPVAKFPLIAKQNLPAEFVFARTNGELVDLNVALSIGDKGEVTQKISSLPGKTLKLVVKPISRARSVTGYFVFKSATPRISQNEIFRSSLTASALFSLNDLVEKNPEPISVENKLVLSSFEYTDPDHDGIYTADVASPLVPGEYEVITVIDYVDPTLGTRQMRMITVVDPEGYVFEQNNGKETRIPSAIVSLYELNTATKKYELWDAKKYQQENPQITDIRGTYSFLVPEGSYYFSVEAPGYNSYQGKVFVVASGAGIHQNIELKSGIGWFSGFDWKTILLIVVFLLLVYNLFRDKLSKFLNKNDGK